MSRGDCRGKLKARLESAPRNRRAIPQGALRVCHRSECPKAASVVRSMRATRRARGARGGSRVSREEPRKARSVGRMLRSCSKVPALRDNCAELFAAENPRIKPELNLVRKEFRLVSAGSVHGLPMEVCHLERHARLALVE